MLHSSWPKVCVTLTRPCRTPRGPQSLTTLRCRPLSGRLSTAWWGLRRACLLWLDASSNDCTRVWAAGGALCRQPGIVSLCECLAGSLLNAGRLSLLLSAGLSHQEQQSRALQRALQSSHHCRNDSAGGCKLPCQTDSLNTRSVSEIIADCRGCT